MHPLCEAESFPDRKFPKCMSVCFKTMYLWVLRQHKQCVCVCVHFQIYKSRHCDEYIDAKREFHSNWMRWRQNTLTQFDWSHSPNSFNFSSFKPFMFWSPLTFSSPSTPSPLLPPGMWTVRVMRRNRTWWPFSTEEPSCTAAAGRWPQGRSCWSGTERSTPESWASPLTTSGTTRAPPEVPPVSVLLSFSPLSSPLTYLLSSYVFSSVFSPLTSPLSSSPSASLPNFSPPFSSSFPSLYRKIGGTCNIEPHKSLTGDVLNLQYYWP